LEKRIESKGFGQNQPIADNKTANGKAQNRRVQIVLGE
jgi:outer membrane protein OmpA-like peptidoglycan-associated protein